MPSSSTMFRYQIPNPPSAPHSFNIRVPNLTVNANQIPPRLTKKLSRFSKGASRYYGIKNHRILPPFLPQDYLVIFVMQYKDRLLMIVWLVCQLFYLSKAELNTVFGIQLDSLKKITRVKL